MVDENELVLIGYATYLDVDGHVIEKKIYQIVEDESDSCKNQKK